MGDHRLDHIGDSHLNGFRLIAFAGAVINGRDGDAEDARLFSFGIGPRGGHVATG